MLSNLALLGIIFISYYLFTKFSEDGDDGTPPAGGAAAGESVPDFMKIGL